MMRRVLGVGVLALIGLTTLTAEADAARAAVFSTGDGAIRGYDPVAYFTDSRAVRGQRELSYRWNGADWYFSSQENLDRFKREPNRYAPQYGGHCAFAMSKGSYASSDPQAWTIHDGKLYLNYSKSIRRKWSKNIPQYVAQADRNWMRLREGA